MAAYDGVIRAMFVLGGAILVAVTVGVCVQVASRYFFNSPLGWVVELSSYGLLFITFLVAPQVLKEDRHVAVDFVLGFFGPRGRAALNLLTAAASAVVCLVLTWFGIRVTWDAFQTHNFTPTMLELPKGAILAIIFIGSFMLFIQLVRVVVGHQRELRGGQKPPPGRE